MHASISTDTSSCGATTNKLPQPNYLGQIARDHAEEYIKIYRPPIHHIKYLRSIRICKTPALGGKKITCNDCGKEHYIYYSCGNSRCSICRAIKREQWMDKLSAILLKVPYVHLVTTMPHDFNGLAKRNEKQMYNLIFRATSITIKNLSSQSKYLGAKTGMVSVLHTFGADMRYHVHVHSLLTFGGIDSDGNWRYPKHKKRLCKNRELRAEYKKVFLEELKKLFDAGLLEYHIGYEELIKDVKNKSWSVFVTHPTMQTNTIELYIARYIDRVAVTNSRLNYVKSNNEIHLLYNDYQNQEEGKAAPKKIDRMLPLIFLGKLLQHIPPPYFQRTRRYGIHANAKSKEVKEAIESKLKRHGRTIRTVMEIISHLMHLKPFVCTECESASITITEFKPDKEWVYQWIILPRIRAPDTRINISHRSTTIMF